ncbi:hypothetical protein PUN4_930022 [Paraburkholderia unamae]|nr:hypothetical protein PUN4_930022 [Paraburkholderia unamae]
MAQTPQCEPESDAPQTIWMTMCLTPATQAHYQVKLRELFCCGRTTFD